MLSFLWCLLYVTVLGILSHYVGEALPREWFHADAAPFKPYDWEQDGRIYERLGIRRWKDHLPDMSRVMRDMTPKRLSWGMNAEQIQNLVAETCVAEMVHRVLCVLSVGICLIMPSGLGLFLTAVYILVFNVPFIMIQRYNRPQLIRLAEKLEARRDRIQNACADTVM